jgi:hypothetical protein
MERIVKYAYRFLFASAVWWACACGADNAKDNGGTTTEMSGEDPDRADDNDGGDRYKTGTDPGEANHEDPTGEKGTRPANGPAGKKTTVLRTLKVGIPKMTRSSPTAPR